MRPTEQDDDAVVLPFFFLGDDITCLKREIKKDGRMDGRTYSQIDNKIHLN